MMPTPILILAILLSIAACVAVMIWALEKITQVASLSCEDQAKATLLAWAEHEGHPFTTDDAAWKTFGLNRDELDQETRQWVETTLLAAGYTPVSYCCPGKTLRMWQRPKPSQPQTQDARRLFQIEGSA